MNYAACPKCLHTALPKDQSLPAACPACGLILAKFAEPRVIRAATTPVTPQEQALFDNEFADDPGWVSRVLLHVPEEISKVNWLGRVVALAAFIAWSVWIWHDLDIPAAESGSHFLNNVLLPFHESGHYLLFRWFGEFIMALGGTLGQHLLPLVFGYVFLVQKRNPFGAALALWLLGFSMINMGMYMYDTLQPQMMLTTGSVGGEGHDWQYLFGRMGLIPRSQGIGMFFGWVGCAMMAAGLGWASVVVWLQKAKLSDSPFAETEHQ